LPSKAFDRAEDRGRSQDDQHKDVVSLHRVGTVYWERIFNPLLYPWTKGQQKTNYCLH
jgi:hypothetical protein